MPFRSFPLFEKPIENLQAPKNYADHVLYFIDNWPKCPYSSLCRGLLKIILFAMLNQKQRNLISFKENVFRCKWSDLKVWVPMQI